MIEIKDLNKSFGFTDALVDINLSFEAGMVYGIIGPNGAGKTTLFNCMAGIISYSGSIRYGEKDMKNRIGLLPTEPYFLSWITGREYLRFICNARKISNVDFDRANIFELPLDSFASTYSSGMKKKLAITGILLQKNQIFILDEPFNGVDIQSNLLITEIILALKAHRRTLVISSHILSSLTDTCDYYVLLNQGKVIRQAPKSEFAEIEKEMRTKEIGNKLERLML